MALKDAIKEQLFITNLIAEIPHFNALSNTLYTDSKSAIDLAKNPQYHHRTKHIDIQYHFVREKYQEGLTNLTYITTEQQLADGLTKPIDQQKLQKLREGIGLKRIRSQPPSNKVEP
jgi:hypothetical protein